MSMEFYNERWVKIKKPRKCEGCLRDFPAGAAMSYTTGVFASVFFTRYLCPFCTKAVQDYCAEVDCEFDYNNVFEYFAAKHCFGAYEEFPVCECHTNDTCEHSIFDCPKLKEIYANRSNL